MQESRRTREEKPDGSGRRRRQKKECLFGFCSSWFFILRWFLLDSLGRRQGNLR
ncbi:hypothetical protein BJX96DRAFT_145290 [Aspergillus floccosus]